MHHNSLILLTTPPHLIHTMPRYIPTPKFYFCIKDVTTIGDILYTKTKLAKWRKCPMALTPLERDVETWCVNFLKIKLLPN